MLIKNRLPKISLKQLTRKTVIFSNKINKQDIISCKTKIKKIIKKLSTDGIGPGIYKNHKNVQSNINRLGSDSHISFM